MLHSVVADTRLEIRLQQTKVWFLTMVAQRRNIAQHLASPVAWLGGDVEADEVKLTRSTSSSAIAIQRARIALPSSKAVALARGAEILIAERLWFSASRAGSSYGKNRQKKS